MLSQLTESHGTQEYRRETIVIQPEKTGERRSDLPPVWNPPTLAPMGASESRL
jgi:hypothetical protein